MMIMSTEERLSVNLSLLLADSSRSEEMIRERTNTDARAHLRIDYFCLI